MGNWLYYYTKRQPYGHYQSCFHITNLSYIDKHTQLNATTAIVTSCSKLELLEAIAHHSVTANFQVSLLYQQSLTEVRVPRTLNTRKKYQGQILFLSYYSE